MNEEETPKPTYPVHGGCVYCTYSEDFVASKGVHILPVPPAVERVWTPCGWRDLCSSHAADVYQKVRFSWRKRANDG